MLPPVAAPGPCAAAKLPFEKIAFQLVALGLRQARKTRAQIAHHIVQSPAAFDDFIGAGYQCRQRLCHEIGAGCGKERDTVMAEHTFKRSPIVLKAPGHDRNIPPAAAMVAYKTEAQGRGFFALGAHARRTNEADWSRAVKSGVGIVKHMLGKKVQGVVVHIAGCKLCNPHGLPQFLRDVL